MRTVAFRFQKPVFFWAGREGGVVPKTSQESAHDDKKAKEETKERKKSDSGYVGSPCVTPEHEVAGPIRSMGALGRTPRSDGRDNGPPADLSPMAVNMTRTPPLHGLRMFEEQVARERTVTEKLNKSGECRGVRGRHGDRKGDGRRWR